MRLGALLIGSRAAHLGARASGAIALALVVLLALLLGRGHPLQNLNEGLYARAAQEMLERHDFVVPTLDGVPYLEKPPLLYWITAGAFAAFGQSEQVARLAPLLGALLALAATAWFARRHLCPEAAWFALPVLASAPIVIVFARTLMFDLLFTGLLFAALVLLYEGLARPDEKRWLRWSCALLALAILAKGLAALAFYGIVAAALVLSRAREERLAAARRVIDPLALALLVGIALPWHLLAMGAQPGFAWSYLVNEHVLRFLGERVPHDYHTGPWWYYLPRVAAYLFPWTLIFLLPAGRNALASEQRAARRFLWLAFLVPLALFSMSEGKGDYYMIVGAPPLALLAADRLARAAVPRATLAALALAWLLAALGVALFGPSHIAPYALPGSYAIQLALAMALAATALVAALAGWRRTAVLACAAVALPCAALYSDFFRTNEPLKSARSLAAPLESGSKPVYVYRGFEAVSALAFYLDSPLGVVDYRGGDLSIGMQLEPQPGRFPDAAAMRERAAVEPLWLVVPESERARFAASPLAGEFVGALTAGATDVYASRPLARQLARELSLASSARSMYGRAAASAR